VSSSFTAFDQWCDPQGHGLCPACTWLYRDRQLRTRPHLVTRNPPTMTWLDPVTFAAQLTLPVTPVVAISVPTRPGRKHVLPAAQWGRVTLDDVPLPWGAADVTRLRILRELRTRGATARELAQQTPPWRHLHRANPRERAHLMQHWSALEPWRTRPTWLRLALLATADSPR
jgi:hypothetical protein